MLLNYIVRDARTRRTVSKVLPTTCKVGLMVKSWKGEFTEF